MGDIERALDSEAPRDSLAEGSVALAKGSASGEAPETSTSRLEVLAVRFEADHPALAASLRRLVDLLAEVGI